MPDGIGYAAHVAQANRRAVIMETPAFAAAEIWSLAPRVQADRTVDRAFWPVGVGIALSGTHRVRPTPSLFSNVGFNRRGRRASHLHP